jgi:hypothetical protein
MAKAKAAPPKATPKPAPEAKADPVATAEPKAGDIEQEAGAGAAPDGAVQDSQDQGSEPGLEPDGTNQGREHIGVDHATGPDATVTVAISSIYSLADAQALPELDQQSAGLPTMAVNERAIVAFKDTDRRTMRVVSMGDVLHKQAIAREIEQ